MVIKADNPILIGPILKLAENIGDVQLDELKSMLAESMTRKDSMVCVEKKDGIVRGYMLGSIERINGTDCVFIQSCYVEPNSNGVCFELLNRFKHWALENNIRMLYFMTQRNAEAFERKYKFEYCGTMLKKELKEA